MRKHKWSLALILIALTLTFLPTLSACGTTPDQSGSSGGQGNQAAPGVPSTVTIAYQPSLGATSLVVLKYQKTLESQFPKTTIQWKLLQSGAAVREAIIANQAQIGFLGVPPFLVGWDKGVKWRALNSLTRSDGWLVAKDPRIKSLKDFTPNDKIAVVAPDSLQAIILRKAAQQQLGDAHALDKNLVSIPPADAMQALLTGQVAANYAYPPFQYQEVEAGAHVVVRSYDVLGQVSSEVIAVPDAFYNQYPDFTKKLYEDIQSASTFASKNHDQTAQYLSQDQNGKTKPEQFTKWLSQDGFNLNTTPTGLLDYARFMQSIGLISKVPNSIQDLELPVLNGVGS